MPQLWETAAALGLPVFPCNHEKKPTCTHGFKEAERDPYKIRALFRRFPGELIGVPTGEPSGIDVLDLDTYKHDTARHFARSIETPVTRAHQTMRGGLHYLFQHRCGLGSSTGHPVPGVDIRADGGYVIYWAAHGYAVNPLPIAPWPPNLIRRFLRKKIVPYRNNNEVGPLNDAKMLGVINCVLRAVNGERNKMLFWASCRVGDWIHAGEIGSGEGERILLAAAQRTGLPYPEASRTISSGFAREH